MKSKAICIMTFAALVFVFNGANLHAQNNNSGNAPAGPKPAMIPPQVDPQEDWPIKIFQLKYINPNEMASILHLFRAEVSVSVVSNPRRDVLTIRAPKDIMPAIEDTIARFDVAPPPA